MFLSARGQRALDLNSEHFGVPRSVLMENAGIAVAEELLKKFPDVNKRPVFVFAGLGNNGGDAFACARALGDSAGIKIFVLGQEERIKSRDSLENLQAVRDRCVFVTSRTQLPGETCDIIIDGIFGTGFSGALSGVARDAVSWINRSKAFVVSIDIPSGLDTDTGAGAAVRADLTVTMHAPKTGFKTKNAKEHLGKVVVKSIGIPRKAEECCGPGDVYLSLKPRMGPEHKGDFGRVLVIAGSQLYTGCVSLASLSAFRTGVDLVYVLAPERAASLAAASPDLITLPLEGRHLDIQHLDHIIPFLEKCDSLLVGNGLGTEHETQEAVLEVLRIAKKLKKQVVIDADGFSALSKNPDILKNTGWILTPHSREFELVSKAKPEAVLGDRVRQAASFAKKYGVTLLLKGPIDIISDGTKTRLNETGNPGMTKGGTGDTLAGLCAGFLAQSRLPFESACAAAFVNGRCGDLLEKEKGYGFLASEIPGLIPKVVFGK